MRMESRVTSVSRVPVLRQQCSDSIAPPFIASELRPEPAAWTCRRLQNEYGTPHHLAKVRKVEQQVHDAAASRSEHGPNTDQPPRDQPYTPLPTSPARPYPPRHAH